MLYVMLLNAYIFFELFLYCGNCGTYLFNCGPHTLLHSLASQMCTKPVRIRTQENLRPTPFFSVPSRSLTSPLKNDGWKTTLLLGWYIFRGYVKLPGGNCIYVMKIAMLTLHVENKNTQRRRWFLLSSKSYVLSEKR